MYEEVAGTFAASPPRTDADAPVVLLVEDNPDIALLVERALQRVAPEVVLAWRDTLASGIDMLGEEDVDCVLADLGLPDSDGLDTVDAFLERAGAPVVVFTALDDPTTALQAVRHGADDYLVKDRFDGAEMVRTIRYAIERHRLHRDREAQVAQREALTRLRDLAHERLEPDEAVEAVVEDALRASETLFRDLAERAQEGIFRLRLVPDLSFEYVNPAVEHITGYSREDFYADAELLRRSLHPADVDVYTDFLTLADHLPDRVEVRFQRGDGDWVWLVLRGSPIVQDGQAVAVQVLVLDETERRLKEEALHATLDQHRAATEELRRLDDMKTGFLQAVSHELRTPLTAVIGYAQTLQTWRDELSPELTAGLVDRIAAAAGRLDKLLGDLLDVDRLRREQIAPRSENVDLRDVVLVALEEIEVEDHELDLDLERAAVAVEPSLFARVVINLVRNAEKHTPHGTRIWVRTRSGDAHVELVVEDDGPGIPDNLRGSIFEPFLQGPRSLHAASPGTGIGLTLVERIVRMHGGDVDIEARTGGGARFRVVLPTEVPDEAAAPDRRPGEAVGSLQDQRTGIDRPPASR